MNVEMPLYTVDRRGRKHGITKRSFIISDQLGYSSKKWRRDNFFCSEGNVNMSI